ncbi:hypothetical protein [Wolbachia endosymbiont (group A) of Lasioglossum lativentre]|uniref:hypothetical protein n=1 Tax=Wolbachia endosymbiont (group A) of Lasioglossum lativentre TaxID=2954023 RepID=UPI0022312227|nr:hypothetical protein [Wolbachia endosymbiont (group A) of Lasioglossum lativentre]
MNERPAAKQKWSIFFKREVKEAKIRLEKAIQAGDQPIPRKIVLTLAGFGCWKWLYCLGF